MDKVLLKTFHELNGKMVEVKRAVPKELSPGHTRSQLGMYNNGMNRVSSFLTGYNQNYNPTSVGGYGLRVDGRYSPVTVGRGGFSPIGPSYNMGMNFEPNLSPSYGGNANLSSNLGYNRGSNSSFVGNSNRYNNGSPIGYSGSNGGNNSLLSRNLWGNGNLNYMTNSANSNAFLGLGSGTSAIWGPSPNSGQNGNAASVYGSGNFNYGTSGDFSVGSRRNAGSGVMPTSPTGAGGGSFDEPYVDIYRRGSFYGGDTTWQSSPSDIEGPRSFGLGLGNTASDVMAKNNVGYVGGYSVQNRQPNRGKKLVPFLL